MFLLFKVDYRTKKSYCKTKTGSVEKKKRTTSNFKTPKFCFPEIYDIKKSISKNRLSNLLFFKVLFFISVSVFNNLKIGFDDVCKFWLFFSEKYTFFGSFWVYVLLHSVKTYLVKCLRSF